MARYLSEDLRVRVIEAVGAGASRRQAAARFGASVSSDPGVAEWRASGRTAPWSQGGDRQSDRIEDEGAFLLARIAETPDVTLAELREALWHERGLRVAVSTLWRFFDRRRITLKKDGAFRRAGAPGREGATARLVRGAARARSGAPRIHRRDQRLGRGTVS